MGLDEVFHGVMDHGIEIVARLPAEQGAGFGDVGDAAARGLEEVRTLSAKDPLEKPWTTEELEGLGRFFRDITGAERTPAP